MHDRGLLHWHSRVKEQVGLFIVLKKNGSLRFIADARRTNSRFGRPLPIQLPSAEGATRTVAPGDGEAFFGFGLDLKDYFHTLKIDEDLSSFCGLMPVRGRELPAELRLAPGLSLDEVRFPCLATLPMGFSWAMYGAQKAHEFLVLTSRREAA